MTPTDLTILQQRKVRYSTPHSARLARVSDLKKPMRHCCIARPRSCSAVRGLGATDCCSMDGLAARPQLAAEQSSAPGHRTGALSRARSRWCAWLSARLDVTTIISIGFPVFQRRCGDGLVFSAAKIHIMFLIDALAHNGQSLQWLQTPEEAENHSFYGCTSLIPTVPINPPLGWLRITMVDPMIPLRCRCKVDGVAADYGDDLEGVTDVRWPLSQYAGEISYADSASGRLRAWISAQNLGENTLIVVTEITQKVLVRWVG